jgi:tRNA(adenine34) deaminase
MNDADFMRLALAEAYASEARGEVPVGAVIVRDGEVIARGGNRNLTDHDPTAHAEVVVMRLAAQKLGNHRLNGCELFVTIEPCAMCAGALVHARMARLAYGAADPKAGAVQSVMQVLNHPSLNHRLDITAGVLGEECAEILRSFFRRKRSSSA